MEVLNPTVKPVLTKEGDLPNKFKGIHHIQLYDEPPTVEMSLDQFEMYALKRLTVLRKLDSTQNTRSSGKSTSGLETVINDNLDSPEVDQISHFILRAAYSLDEEKRRWFLNQETQLFKFRLENALKRNGVTQFCKIFKLTPLGAKEQQEKAQLLRMLLPKNMSTVQSQNTKFYKVPFTQALDLVAKRQCVVERGFAYIPDTKVISILSGKFRMQLSAALAHLAQTGIYPDGSSSEADRLNPLLKNMNSCLLDSEPTEEGLSDFQSSQVTPTNIPKLVKHMPLCMATMQRGLKNDKKLRYNGRLQYGLFLKGAGLSMEESMQFFQKSFSNMTPEAWQKEYAYNIRHMYGKEGHKKSKTAYSCSGIINSPAPSHPGDNHGCPYKNYDADKLSKLLQSLKIGTPQDRKAIINLQKERHFNLACLEHFKVMHPDAESKKIDTQNIGNHPNAWFRASMEYEEKTKGGSPIKTEEITSSSSAGSPDVAKSS